MSHCFSLFSNVMGDEAGSNDIKQLLIDIWVRKITNKMKQEESASVSFLAGKDFKHEEINWIGNVLSPALLERGMSTSMSYYPLEGEGTSCDCVSSICRHVTGRKLQVTLKSESQ